MIKVSDYLARRVAELGVTHVFMVTGGGAMHLDDSFGMRDDLTLIFNHHEQACAIGVEGYARVRGDIGVAVVTTGPGGTNTITGVLGQWHDSVPALYLSGQVRYDTTVASSGLPLRQLGDQEADIVAIVSSITKYAVTVTDPTTIRYHFDKAVHLARSGRPGPVWLDVPLNVQGAFVEEDTLGAFLPDEGSIFDVACMDQQVSELVDRLQAAKRPVLLAGSGIRTAGAHDSFLELVDKLGIPVVTAWNATDAMYDTHLLYIGHTSSAGHRAANFAVQNADLLLSVGCRLNLRQTGYLWDAFAREAYLAVVDIDATELRKPTISPDMPIHADAAHFIETLSSAIDGVTLPDCDEWVDWCLERRRRYPAVLPEYWDRTEFVDNYVACDVLSDLLQPGEVVVQANGSACIVGSQAMRLPRNSIMMENSGTASMGWELPAAIGACVAAGRRVVCLSGDGSIMMNLQELQTIAQNALPVKIVLFNNDGYVSIRQTQDNLFAGHRVGEGPESGVVLPDFQRVAAAFGIPSCQIANHAGLEKGLTEALASPGPYLCEVMINPGQLFMPKVQAEKLPDGSIVSKPLEDMWPFLPRSEFAESMLVSFWDDKG